MSIPWTEFLQDLQNREPSLLAFALNWWSYNMPLLRVIRQTVPPPARVLEVGTGTGALAIMLAAYGYEVLGIDVDPRVIEGARAFAEPLRLRCRFEVGDGFDLGAHYGGFDLAFSAGVIEHFHPESGVQMLREKGRAGTYVLAVVPTWYALRNDPLTDASGARPIRLPELKGLFRRAGLNVLKGFAYGDPDGGLSRLYRYLVPRAVQLIIANSFSYAGTVGCIGSARGRGGLPRREE